MGNISNPQLKVILLILASLFEIEITCSPNPNRNSYYGNQDSYNARARSVRGGPGSGSGSGASAIPSPYRERLPIFFSNTEPDLNEDYKNDPEIPGPAEPPPSLEQDEESDQQQPKNTEMATRNSKPKSKNKIRSRESLEDRVSHSEPDTHENNVSGEIWPLPSGVKNSFGQGKGQEDPEKATKGRGEDMDENSNESIRKYGRSDFEGRYIPKDSHEGQIDPLGYISGYPGIGQPMYAHPDDRDYPEDQENNNNENGSDRPPGPGGSECGSSPNKCNSRPGPGPTKPKHGPEDRTVSAENSKEPTPADAANQNPYDATYNSDHNWKVQHPSPPTQIDYSPFPGFSRPCQSYFDCDFQPDEQKNRPTSGDNSESTWFSCDGSYCTCELFGFARDDEASWRVRWSPKSKQCIAEAEGPCGRSDGLNIYCQLGYNCVDNMCEKIGKPRRKKPTDDCDDDKNNGGGVNLFSVLFFPKNIVDSILNDTLTASVGQGGGGKTSNNYNTY